MEQNPDNHVESKNLEGRSVKGMWLKGVSGNPNGRPKGKTMKEWAKDYLSRMTDEERDEFMAGIPKEVIWKMSEGNPHATTDVTSGGEQINQLLVKFIDAPEPKDN